MNAPTRLELADLLSEAFGPEGATAEELRSVASRWDAHPRLVPQLDRLPRRRYRTMQDLWPDLPEESLD